MELVDRENGVIRGIFATKEDEFVGAEREARRRLMHRGNVVNPSAIVWIKNTKARELDDGYPHAFTLK